MAHSTKTQTNGVLPVSASQTASNGTQKPAAGKPTNPKLKVLVRRLPPGLTEAEFLSILGADWRIGGGKVDWLMYKSGKDSKDPSKPSRPARAYLHLTNESHLLPLSEAVRQAIFEDALNTATSPCLVGPPNVEFAPFGRVPGGRRRVDARAGTIDQDLDFMAFLEGLANPVSAKDVNAESPKDTASGKAEKVTTTPLVQYLKDRKASKKEALIKGNKKQEMMSGAKGKGGKDSSGSPEESRKKGKDVKVDRAVERAAKEAVRILNREALNKSLPDATTSKAGSSSTGQAIPPKLDLAKVPGRQRGPVIAAHIKMLQRDLGLSPAQAHRQIRRDTADALKAEKDAAAAKENTPLVTTPAASPSSVPTAPKSSIPVQTVARGPRNRGTPTRNEASKQSIPPTPMVLLKKPEVLTPVASPAPAPAKVAPASNARRGPAAAVPSNGATQAFIKHANPSQGVTEALLKEALGKFGAVSFVEIDKRKGFAYVDFAETDGLKKAMAANPIPVAQGTVHVAQRKGPVPAQVAPAPTQAVEKKPTPQIPTAPANRGGRGGHGRGGTAGRRGARGPRGGGSASIPAPSVPTGPSGK